MLQLWVRRVGGLLAVGVGRAGGRNRRIYLCPVVRIGSLGLMVWPILLVLGHRRTVLLRRRLWLLLLMVVVRLMLLLLLLLLSHTWCARAVGWVVRTRKLRLVEGSGTRRVRVYAVGRRGSSGRRVIDLVLDGILCSRCVICRRSFRVVVAEVARIWRWQTCLRIIAGSTVHMASRLELCCRRMVR